MERLQSEMSPREIQPQTGREKVLILWGEGIEELMNVELELRIRIEKYSDTINRQRHSVHVVNAVNHLNT